MSRLTDPDGNTTIFLVDADGNSVAQIDPMGHMSFVSFNQDNQKTLTVDADGGSIEYTYDPADRETAEVWLNAAGVQQNAVSLGYDDAKNLTSASNNYGSYGFTLDSANRITAETTPFSLTVGFGYDSNANVTSMTFAGATETSVYNGDDLLTSRRLSGGPSGAQLRFDITYTVDNQIATVSRYADTAGTTFLGETQDTYDSAGNITEIKHTNSSATVLEDFQYTWTLANLLSSETDTISGTPTTTNYGYDTSAQLTSAGSASYSFDPSGNRTMSGYGIGPGNQITTDGTWNYSYDPAGNLIEKVGISNGLTWKFSYDNKNELIVAAEYSGGTLQYQISYFYDPFGNVAEQDETQSGTTTVTRFLNDQYGNAIADLNSSNAVQFVRVFLNASDAEIARIFSDGSEYWYLANHLGSVTGLMNNSGALGDTITYDGFGDMSETAPSVGDRYKFAGGEYNSTSVLSGFAAREYSPTIGGWTSQDPIGFRGGDSNLYRYVKNSPTNAVDLSGLFPGDTRDPLHIGDVNGITDAVESYTTPSSLTSSSALSSSSAISTADALSHATAPSGMSGLPGRSGPTGPNPPSTLEQWDQQEILLELKIMLSYIDSIMRTLLLQLTAGRNWLNGPATPAQIALMNDYLDYLATIRRQLLYCIGQAKRGIFPLPPIPELPSPFPSPPPPPRPIPGMIVPPGLA